MTRSEDKKLTRSGMTSSVLAFKHGIEKAFSSIIGVTLSQNNPEKMMEQAGRFTTSFQTIACVPFSGGVTGEFFICVHKEDWVQHLSEVSGLEPTDPGMSELLYSTLQEIINTAAGEAIGHIKDNYGVVTMMSPRLIEGHLIYPATQIYSLSFSSEQNSCQLEGKLSIDHMEQEINVEHEKLKKDSRLDDTGLFNKKHFIEVLADIEKKYDVAGGFYTIIFIDINRLKFVNDTYGHDAGDAYIQGACNILKQSCRFSDFCFRIGGDELVIILPKCKKEDAAHVIRRIRTLTNTSYIEVNDEKNEVQQIQINMSIGCASNSEKDVKTNDVLKTADMRMEEDKREWYKQQDFSRRK